MEQAAAIETSCHNSCSWFKERKSHITNVISLFTIALRLPIAGTLQAHCHFNGLFCFFWRHYQLAGCTHAV